MRKFLRSLAGFACIASVILAGCEEPDGGCNLLWTLGWMALALVLAVVLDKTSTKKTTKQ